VLGRIAVFGEPAKHPIDSSDFAFVSSFLGNSSALQDSYVGPAGGFVAIVRPSGPLRPSLRVRL